MNLKEKNTICSHTVDTDMLRTKIKKNSKDLDYDIEKSESFNQRLEHSLFDNLPKTSTNPLEFGDTLLKAKEVVHTTNKLLNKIGCWKRLKVNIDCNDSCVKRKKLDNTLNTVSTDVFDSGTFISPKSQTSGNNATTNLYKNSQTSCSLNIIDTTTAQNVLNTNTPLKIVNTTASMNIIAINNDKSKSVSDSLHVPKPAQIFSSLDGLKKAPTTQSVGLSYSKHNNTQQSNTKKSLIWESNSHIAVVSASSNEAQNLLKNIKSLASILCPSESNGIAFYRFTGSKHQSKDATSFKTNTNENDFNIRNDDIVSSSDIHPDSSITNDEESVNSTKD